MSGNKKAGQYLPFDFKPLCGLMHENKITLKRNDIVKRVLIVEDDHVNAMLFEINVKELGHEVVAIAHSGPEAIRRVNELEPDVVFMDISLDDRMEGIDACKSIKETHPQIKVYFLTGYAPEAYEKELAQVPYDGYIDKMNFEKTASKYIN